MAKVPELELFYGGDYFKGESIRLCAAYAGIPLKDTRPTSEQFQEMKGSGELPFGQMPYLKIDGGKVGLSQSSALCRMIGRMADPALELYPSDPVFGAKVDMIMAQDADMRTGHDVMNYQMRFGIDLGGKETEAFQKIRTELITNVLPTQLGFFEKLLADSTTGWLAGTEKPTIVDFYMSGSFYWLTRTVMKDDLLAPYPKILEHRAKVHALPQIKAWHDAHPENAILKA